MNYKIGQRVKVVDNSYISKMCVDGVIRQSHTLLTEASRVLVIAIEIRDINLKRVFPFKPIMVVLDTMVMDMDTGESYYVNSQTSLRSYCEKIEMSISEIEQHLRLGKGSLRIKE